MGNHCDDLENALALRDLISSDTTNHPPPLRNIGFSSVTDQIWHFSSVDYGPRCTLNSFSEADTLFTKATDMCVGYNTLSVIPTGADGLIRNEQDKPEGTRLWSWLIMCDDGTVVSIQENPFPRQKNWSDPYQLNVLHTVRRNVRYTCAGVSRQFRPELEIAASNSTRVRYNHDDAEAAHIRQDDGPGLLFYCIFDNWISTFGLMAKQEHQYGIAVERALEGLVSLPRETSTPLVEISDLFLETTNA